ncbi:type II secretion system F family protein [Vibrio marisflavi]|uniref:Type II secretion system protein GspF domain-containing protein n=1 Tax=Vibrio marisflavi CECT 7928 TaxID=634439 RepID=A0ABN8E4F3_9VIBR|nr:type II secretion system F family protein [Vibrio marisflavi]CAH0540332.1 hypothetical protein VMF7928_02777 [Vibrio marisflavi CECT 7928]
MSSWLWIVFIVVGLVLCVLMTRRQQHTDYLEEELGGANSLGNGANQAVNLKSFTKETTTDKLKTFFRNTRSQIGSYAPLKILAFMIVVAMIGLYVNHNFIRGNQFVVVGLTEVLGIVLGIRWLRNRERKHFEDTFPDALNVLASAMSTGESINQSIKFVGDSLEGAVGNEFKLMAERIQLGEAPESAFKKSRNRFPYPTFHFFVITLIANINRGGQLKEIITRLNRIMYNNRAMEKRKKSMTSEVRVSAKIVAAIPFIFLFMLQYLSPENYEFVMFNEAGRPILYYVLASESFGLFLVWWLMNGVDK